MGRARQGRGTWRETQVQLSRTTVTTFEGPGDDFTIVVHGRRKGAPKVVRQNEGKRSTNILRLSHAGRYRVPHAEISQCRFAVFAGRYGIDARHCQLAIGAERLHKGKILFDHK